MVFRSFILTNGSCLIRKSFSHTCYVLSSLPVMSLAGVIVGGFDEQSEHSVSDKSIYHNIIRAASA